jgi:hypothetical protein
MDTLGYWLQHLRDLKVIGDTQLTHLEGMRSSEYPGVSDKVVEFGNRMRRTHPDLWLTFKAKQRILGLSSSNLTHIHQHL